MGQALKGFYRDEWEEYIEQKIIAAKKPENIMKATIWIMWIV